MNKITFLVTFKIFIVKVTKSIIIVKYMAVRFGATKTDFFQIGIRGCSWQDRKGLSYAIPVWII